MSILKGQNFSQKVTNQTIIGLCFSEMNFFSQRVAGTRETLLLKKEMVK